MPNGKMDGGSRSQGLEVFRYLRQDGCTRLRLPEAFKCSIILAPLTFIPGQQSDYDLTFLLWQENGL